ncbi:MAG: nucleotide exchange factor GrpE [Bacteroidota bacterium]
MAKNKKQSEPTELENEAPTATETMEKEEVATEKAEETVELTPEEEIIELKQQVGELKDKYLRVYAEFENFRKRSVREKLDMMKTAAQDTMSALLPVLDDFDRAKKSADSPDSEEKFSEGIELLYNKIYNVLQNKGLTPMESTGETFDAELHEAVTEIPAPTEEMKGKVIDTIEKGYKLKDKIIRHAKVVVGK